MRCAVSDKSKKTINSLFLTSVKKTLQKENNKKSLQKLRPKKKVNNKKVATCRVARSTLQTLVGWLVDVATDRPARYP